MDLEKKLYKSSKNKIIGGVCGGLGEYFNIDPTLVRLGFVGLCIIAGGGLLAYIVALIIMPDAPAGYDPKAQANDKPHSASEATGSSDTSGSSDNNSDGDTPTLI